MMYKKIFILLLFTSAKAQVTVVPGKNGGTGIANTGKTITIGGSIITTGIATPTLGFPPANRTYRFRDSSGTVALTADIPLFYPFIPLSGTTPSNPLTKLIEYRGVAGSTAFVDTMGDFYNGVGNLKDLKSATKYSYIHFGILSHSNLFQQIDFRTNDSISNSGLSLKPGGSDFFNSNSSGLSGIYINSAIPPLGSKSTILQIDSADLIINASYNGFKGLQYNSGDYGFVATNGDQYTTFPKRYNDSIYAPSSVTNFTLHANAPLSASSSTVSLNYGTGLAVSSGSLVTSAIPNSSLANSTFTVNGTGMALGTSSTVTSAAGTLTGTTLNSSVVTSSLTAAGTFTTGIWNATKIGLAYGGTNSDLSSGAAIGDIIQASSTTAFSRLAAGAAGTMLRSTGTGSLTAWSTTTWPNTVTANNILYATGTSAIGSSGNFQFDGQVLQFNANSNLTRDIVSINGTSSNSIGRIRIFAPSLGVGVGYFSANLDPLYLGTDNTAWATMKAAQLYIGGAVQPTANLHIAAGTASANTAPIKFTSGTNLTTAEAGAWEYDGTHFFATPSGTTRYQIGTVLTATATIDFASTAAGTVTTNTMTLTGAADGDAVSLGTPNGSRSTTDVSGYEAWISATNVVTIKFWNANTIGAVDPASATFKVTVIKN